MLQWVHPTYFVQFWCEADPARPRWRDDDSNAYADTDQATARAMEIFRSGRPAVRVIDEKDRPVFQYGRSIAA